MSGYGYLGNIGGYLDPISSSYFWKGRAPGQVVKPSWVDYYDTRYLLTPEYQSFSRVSPELAYSVAESTTPAKATVPASFLAKNLGKITLVTGVAMIGLILFVRYRKG